ncbi:MAG: TIGR03936 family radical SAM-associated protein [Bacillota bacterium]
MTRICFNFARNEKLKHISHLDMMRLFQRALRRSGLPLAYSEGFSPHPRFNLAAPLPVGVTADEEFGEVFFTGEITLEEFVAALKKQLPDGLQLKNAFILNNQAPPIPSIVSAALYRAHLEIANLRTNTDVEEYRSALARLIDKEEILAPRSSKKGKKKTYVNVRPYIFEANLDEQGNANFLSLNLLLQTGSKGGVSPVFVLEQLEQELGDKQPQHLNWDLHRVKLYRDRNGSLEPLSEGMCING